MTDTYIPQSSSSDRYTAARKALAAFEGEIPEYQAGYACALADALRSLIAPPGVHESEEDAVSREHEILILNLGLAGVQITTDLDSITRHEIRNAYRAGIQAAHATWEPEVALRPTQEQMLRWLGVQAIDSIGDDGLPSVYIYEQHIERED